MYERKERCIQSVGEETEGNRQLGRPTHRWEDNIKSICMKWEGRAWTGLSCLGIGTGGGVCYYYRVYQNDCGGLEFDYIYEYAEETYKY